MEPALTIGAGAETFTLDDNELCALSEMNTLYGVTGANIGHFLVSRATIAQGEARQIAQLLRNIRAKLDEPLVVYDHGRGAGTVCFQHRSWYELVSSAGVRYAKPTARYVKGEKGKLASVDSVIYAKGRSVKDSSAKPQTLRDVAPLVSALDKLEAALTLARQGAVLTTSPRQTYEYF